MLNLYKLLQTLDADTILRDPLTHELWDADNLAATVKQEGDPKEMQSEYVIHDNKIHRIDERGLIEEPCYVEILADHRWKLDTGTDGCDEDELIGSRDEVMADVMHHHDLETWPEHWTLSPKEKTE